jgi:putative transcriptional regulator
VIRHHPSPDILVEYAGGTLQPGAMLVVACHLAACAVCRQEAGLWECVGGALLEDASPAPLPNNALAQMLSRLEDDTPQPKAPTPPKYLQRFAIPAPLAAQKIGHRHWVTPGIWFAPVAAPAGSDARTYLVYARANTVLAEHRHAGREFTHVLAGAFSDDSGVYDAGDFALAENDLEHAPTVTGDGECLCLISADAPMRLKSFPARLIQAITGTLY